MCLKVYELTLHYTQHWDHNVVTAALELLQQMFRTPPPELLHMLITSGSIQHATVFRQDTESRARSGSILELIGKHISQTGLFVKLVIPFVQCDVGSTVFYIVALHSGLQCICFRWLLIH